MASMCYRAVAVPMCVSGHLWSLDSMGNPLKHPVCFMAGSLQAVFLAASVRIVESGEKRAESL